ncbi:hypothetical protein BDW02DRAFT_573775 [Decorospora gaudefroyi]|uniref:Uncharacterized protein n=1 Tax=Decorospora gaudefroyi TaxID=184978 RepID=A0A6A5JYZ5_9PLEO|nr:hypothetical protein BDW02DRAFT_573775 [Decorospora gaudefroyi]
MGSGCSKASAALGATSFGARLHGVRHGWAGQADTWRCCGLGLCMYTRPRLFVAKGEVFAWEQVCLTTQSVWLVIIVVRSENVCNSW